MAAPGKMLGTTAAQSCAKHPGSSPPGLTPKAPRARGVQQRRGGTWHMGGARGVPRPANHSSPRCSSRSPRRVPPGAVAGSSGRFSTKMLAGPACSLPPLQQLLSCTFTSSSKGFFQNEALSRHNNKTTTLIFLAETSTKRVTQKTFLKFFFFLSSVFFPQTPHFSLKANLC